MSDPIRDAFESTTLTAFNADATNFSRGECHFEYGGSRIIWDRKRTGQYEYGVIEDHWQTFQEGWEAAIEFLKTKQVSSYSDKYSDVISNGGKDVR